MRRNQGFTLIELMIVIAIIAIIAAIAIPGLLQSQRASNERNASASLKTLASAQADFRANDRDGNKVNDFWTEDVAGLYGVCPVGSTEMLKLIEISVAGADAKPIGASGTPAAATNTLNSFYTTRSPKAGFWYRHLLSDEDGSAYATDTAGTGWTGNRFNHSKFGVQAFPDTRSAGRSMFIINEGNTIFKRGVSNTYAKPAGVPGTGATGNCTGMVGSHPDTSYPNDTSLKSDYGKMD